MLYREANPGKFNNRVRNKMYYTQVWCFKTFQTLNEWTVIHIYEDQTWLNNYQAGGLDLLKAKWKKLSEYATNTLTAINLRNIKPFQLPGMSALNVMVRTSLPSLKNTRYTIEALLICGLCWCRCTQCSFWTSLALDLALDHGTRPKEHRRWTMDSLRFEIVYLPANYDW